jgi:hypothetical protein
MPGSSRLAEFWSGPGRPPREAGPKLVNHDERQHDRLGFLQHHQRLPDAFTQIDVAIRVESNPSPPEILVHAVLLGERCRDRLIGPSRSARCLPDLVVCVGYPSYRSPPPTQEQAGSFCAMVEQELNLPFETTVLGVRVSANSGHHRGQ